MYAIIEFVRGERETIKECALVPVLWLTADNTLCYWPRTKTEEKFRSLVMANAAYEQSWPTFAVHQVLHTVADYDLAVKYMTNVLDNGTSEDGITFQPVTQRKLVINDEIQDNGDQLLESEISKKRKKKGHKRDKRQRKNKRSKYAKSSSSGSSGISSRIPSSNDENEPQNGRRFERSLTGLEQNLSITAEGRGISVHTEMHGNTQTPCSTTATFTGPRTNLDSTPDRSFINRNNAVQTPRSSNLTPNRSVVDRNDAFQTPRSSIVHSTPGASHLTLEDNTISSQLKQISAAIDQNQIILSQILRINQTLSEAQGCTMPQGFPDFPIVSSEIFDEFNAMLENEAHRTYLKLASVGGLSQRQAVMNMLKFVMSNSLAMMYNWAGREKKCFKKTKFMTILNEAAKLAFRGKTESSDLNIASAVKDWLKLATSRHMYAVTGKNNTPK